MGETREQSFEFTGVDPSGVSSALVSVMHVKLTSANIRHMMKTAIVEDLYPGAAQRISRMGETYPAAAVIHHEFFHGDGRRMRVLNRKQLIDRSRAFVDLPLEKRDY